MPASSIFKCLVLSDKQNQNPKASVCKDTKERKAAKVLAFSLDKLLQRCIDHHNVADFFSIDHFRATRKAVWLLLSTCITMFKAFFFFFLHGLGKQQHVMPTSRNASRYESQIKRSSLRAKLTDLLRKHWPQSQGDEKVPGAANHYWSIAQ